MAAGSGYTRRSIADIVNGENITAPPINAELNAIQTAFDGSDGHSHDGTLGNAPKINLVGSVDGYLPATHGGSGGLNNATATENPNGLDDTDDGYAVGSMWINVTTRRVFICTDNTVGSAQWHEFAAFTPQGHIIPDGAASDIGSSSSPFRNLYLSGSFVAGTLDGELGANTPAAITATDITADTVTATPVDNGHSIFGNLLGNATGNFKGDIYSPDDTLILNNGTDGTDASFIGSVTGNVTGNITSTGDSVFGDITATDITAVSVTATFTGDLLGDTQGTHTGPTIGSHQGDVSGNLSGNSTGTHTGPVDAQNTRISNVADPVDLADALSLAYFNQVLSSSEDGIASSLAQAEAARDNALTYRDETLYFRNETEGFRDETFAARDQSNLARDIAVTKAAQVSILYDSSQYSQRLIGSLI
jgi:hypothetical protein